MSSQKVMGIFAIGAGVSLSLFSLIFIKTTLGVRYIGSMQNGVLVEDGLYFLIWGGAAALVIGGLLMLLMSSNNSKAS